MIGAAWRQRRCYSSTAAGDRARGRCISSHQRALWTLARDSAPIPALRVNQGAGPRRERPFEIRQKLWVWTTYGFDFVKFFCVGAMIDWETLVKLAGPPGAAVALLFNFHMSALKEEGSIAEIKDGLGKSFSLHQSYLASLESFLCKLDKIFGPEAFGAMSYGACLRLSLAYILGSVMLIWFVSGEDTSGISNAFPLDCPWYTRAFAITCCGAASACLYHGMKQQGLRAGIWSLVAIVLSFGGSYVVGGEDFAVLSAVTSAVVVSAIATIFPSQTTGYAATAKIFAIAGICALAISIPLFFLGTQLLFIWAVSISAAAFLSASVSFSWTWCELRSKAHIFHIVFSLTAVASVKGAPRRSSKLAVVAQGNTITVTESGGCGRTARLNRS